MLRQVRVDEGLFWSVNTPTVATAYQLDLCDITSLTTQLGITRALDSSPLQPDDPSFLLGKDSVAPLSLAGAYAAIAANGLYCEPRAILTWSFCSAGLLGKFERTVESRDVE